LNWARGYVRHFDGDVQKPVAACVLREVRTVLDLAFGQRPAAEPRKVLPAKRNASPPRFKSRPLRGTHPSDFRPRYQRCGRRCWLRDFAYCSHVAFTVPEWMLSSLLLPVVSTFRSKPGLFLPHFSACFCVSLQKF
jgi:hypothetical protein